LFEGWVPDQKRGSNGERNIQMPLETIPLQLALVLTTGTYNLEKNKTTKTVLAKQVHVTGVGLQLWKPIRNRTPM
jgi:hypothetical protein